MRWFPPSKLLLAAQGFSSKSPASTITDCVEKDIADETTPAADDYLAQLTVKWEAATQPVEELGVRRVVARVGR